jgi:hypothetical protein
MTNLTKLNISDKTKAAVLASPEERLRNRLLDALETQIAAAEAEATGKSYTKLKSRYVTNEDTGERTKKQIPVPVRPWWWKDASGNIVLNIRYGNRCVELKPGKTAIEVGKPDRLVPTLNLIADAVKAGELDEILLAMKSDRTTKSSKSR